MIRALLLVLALAAPAVAQEAARLDAAASSVTLGPPQGWFGRNRPRPITLHLGLTAPVPFRLFLLDGPPRLVADLPGLDLAGADPARVAGAGDLPGLRWGTSAEGAARIVAELPGPYRIAGAIQRTGGAAPVIEITLLPVAVADFAPRPGADAALRALAGTTGAAPSATPAAALLHVVLDPGHGGADPGAQSGGVSEGEIVLGFARDLAAALRARGVQVTLTRENDRYLGLEQRMTAARAAGGELFLSIHADALPRGQAAGAAVYVWAAEGDDQATAQLAARHGRDDLLAGVDLTGADDALAGALIDIARADTRPRSENFAKFLASGMALDGIGLHRRPVKGADFAVLKAPDIPSVLLELGFITDPTDRANLTDPTWQARMVGVVAQAVVLWAEDEAQRRPLLRR